MSHKHFLKKKCIFKGHLNGQAQNWLLMINLATKRTIFQNFTKQSIEPDFFLITHHK